MKTKLIEDIKALKLKQIEENWLIEDVKSGKKNNVGIYLYLSSFKKECEISHFLDYPRYFNTKVDTNYN